MNHQLAVELLIAAIIGSMFGVLGYYLSRYLRKPVEASLRSTLS